MFRGTFGTDTGRVSGRNYVKMELHNLCSTITVTLNKKVGTFQSPPHEGTEGKQGYSPTHWTEVSAKRHAPAALPRAEPDTPRMVAGWAPEPVRMF